MLDGLFKVTTRSQHKANPQLSFSGMVGGPGIKKNAENYTSLAMCHQHGNTSSLIPWKVSGKGMERSY